MAVAKPGLGRHADRLYYSVKPTIGRTRWEKLKVLFLQDVRPTARAGDVKEVKDGFGRNYLIPQGYAVIATEHELRRAAGLR